MKNRVFKGVKDFFKTDDVFWETEVQANIILAFTMIISAIILALSWVLNELGIFLIQKDVMTIVTIEGLIGLLVPAILCFALKGERRWLKLLLLIIFIIVLSMLDAMLTYNVMIIMALPLVISCRYYSRQLTIVTAVVTAIMFAISAYMGTNIGMTDLNYVQLNPETTSIAVTGTLDASVITEGFDKERTLFSTFTESYMPKLFVFILIAIISAEIAKCGRNMVLRQEEIVKKSARIESELDLATKIQMNMLPHEFPNSEKYEVFANMIPAKEVGGDFYDVFKIDDTHLALIMSDVSGKGVPAALFMAISKTLIKTNAKRIGKANETYNLINNILCDGNQTGLFVTSWMGILDTETGMLKYVNAGHNPPLYYSKENNSFSYVKVKPNFVLAGMENIKYKEYELQLKPGDKLFLYTDGVTEATNAQKELYGEDRLLEYLNNNCKEDVKTVIEGLKSDIDKFVGEAEQFDDITMLELNFTNPNPVVEEVAKEKEENNDKQSV